MLLFLQFVINNPKRNLEVLCAHRKKIMSKKVKIKLMTSSQLFLKHKPMDIFHGLEVIITLKILDQMIRNM